MWLHRLQPVAVVGLSLLFVVFWACLGTLGGALVLAAASGGSGWSTDPSNAALLDALVIGAAVGALPAALWALHVWRRAATMALRSVHAVVADHDHYGRLLHVVEELSVAAGLRVPTALVVEVPALNAFSVSGRRGRAAIVVTSAVLHELPREELEAVVAHELVHIRDRDGVVPLFTGVLVGRLIEITDFPLGDIRFWFLWPACWVVAGLARGLKALSSRHAAEITDLASIEFTRDPDGLIAALERMAWADRTLRRGTARVDRLLFVPPCEHARARLTDGVYEPAGMGEIQRRIGWLRRLVHAAPASSAALDETTPSSSALEAPAPEPSPASPS